MQHRPHSDANPDRLLRPWTAGAANRAGEHAVGGGLRGVLHAIKIDQLLLVGRLLLLLPAWDAGCSAAHLVVLLLGLL